MQPQVLKDKLPPYNDEAEKAVLGAILVSPEVLSEVIKSLTDADFYRTEHKTIFNAMKEIDSQSTRIDLLSLTNHLKQNGTLDKCGGIAYLSNLQDAVPTAANIKYYTDLVQDCSYRRSILYSAQEMIRQAHDDTVTSRNLVEKVEHDIFNLVNRQKTSEILKMESLIPVAIQNIQAAYKAKASMLGVPTGFQAFDDMTQGFQKQDFVIIGARPSIGKTAFALSMTLNMITKYKIPVGFFSLEMGANLLISRLLSQDAKLDSKKIRSGYTMQNSDFARLNDSAERLYGAPLFIDDTPNIPLLDLRANARRMVKDYGVKIIFIDYIGLITSERGGNVPRHEQVSEISRSLKALARELDIPIVALCQVSRDSEGEEPKLSNLRDSGSIEQDADIVMFLHRNRETSSTSSKSSYSNKNAPERLVVPNEEGDKQENETAVTKLIIAKHRNGPTGILDLNFVKRYTLFTDYSRDQG